MVADEDNWLWKIYPMSLRTQAYEIISFWTFTTIVKALFHTKSIPWKTVMVSGHALDSQGKPMHKSAGNTLPPEPFIEKYGSRLGEVLG